jgi:multiple sugar transport system permease protein
VILSGIFSAFPVFLTQYYFRKIPDSMMEAAKLDGAGEWQSFCRIGIPLSKPAIFTSVILNFLDYWGNLEQVTVFIDSQKHWTLPMFITSIKLDYAGTAFAASVFSMIPPILLILYGKEDLENGLGALSLKE